MSDGYPYLSWPARNATFSNGTICNQRTLETDEGRAELVSLGVPADEVEMARCILEARPGPGQDGYPGPWPTTQAAI